MVLELFVGGPFIILEKLEVECWFAPITAGRPNCILGIELVTWGPSLQSDRLVSPAEWQPDLSIIPRTPVASQTPPPLDLCWGPRGAKTALLYGRAYRVLPRASWKNRPFFFFF